MLTKNNGIIYARSEPGKGSRFTFTLPLVSRHDAGVETLEAPPELSPAEITENLLASEIPVSEEALTDLKSVIKPQFEEVSKVLSIENLEVFSRSVTRTGEKYGLVQLANYGKSLNTLTRAHQIDQIIRMLPRFRDYLSGIIKTQ
jgi:hypothetical protein